jgi:hypothetical protein
MAKNKKLFVTKLVRKNSETPFYHEVVSKDFQRFYTDEENAPQVDTMFKIFNIDADRMTTQELLEANEAHHHDDGTPCEEICICGPMTGMRKDSAYFNLVKTIEDTENSNLLLSFPQTDLPEYIEHLEYNKQNDISIDEFFVDADDNWDPINPLT